MTPPQIALLHGLGADSRAFQRFARLLPDTWDVTCFDLLGHGDAAKPRVGYTMDDHGHYIGSILHRESDHPWIIVGHSYGAGVGTAAAAMHPELVSQLILLDPIDNPGLRSLEAQGMASPAVDPLSSSMHPDRPHSAAAGGSRGSGTAQMMQARRDGNLAETVDRLFANEGPPLRAWIVQTWEAMSVGVIDEFDPDWMRFAPKVTCPVTLIHGDTALGGGGPGPAQYFDQEQTGLTKIRVEGAGHYLHATHARMVAEYVVTSVAESTAR